jgi:hypothetical protein
MSSNRTKSAGLSNQNNRFLELLMRTEMAAKKDGSTSISARRVDTMERTGTIGGTEDAEAAQRNRRLREERGEEMADDSTGGRVATMRAGREMISRQKTKY